jgi:hypothetical protein
MPALTIARAAREAGVNIEAVRFYERRGLIERPPKGEGYRVYSPDHVARIRFIKAASETEDERQYQPDFGSAFGDGDCEQQKVMQRDIEPRV